MRTFDQSATRWRAKQERLRERIVDTALDLRRDIQRGNPVLSGRSCASWNLRAGRMDGSRQPQTYWNPGEGRFLDARTDVGAFKLGQTIHISNLQDYIQHLESAHRTAAGWIRRTLDLYRARIPVKLRGAMR